LNYSLVTQWTAFVAVSERIYNPVPELTLDAEVPLEKVLGVSRLAYGESESSRHGAMASPSNPAMGGGFVGSSTPEPRVVFGIALVMLMLTGVWLRDRRACKFR
jgi:Ca-activated chloride channel family protein